MEKNIINKWQFKYGVNIIMDKKQETIEEAGVAYAKTVNQNHTSHMLGFYNGAKWQAERMYSEEEVISILYEQLDALDFYGSDFKFSEWFEEFKKK